MSSKTVATDHMQLLNTWNMIWLKCAPSVKYIPDFEDLVGKRDCKNISLMILYWLYVEIIVAWIDGVKQNVLIFFEETKTFWKMKSGKQNDKWWQSNWKWGSHGNGIRGEHRFLLNIQLKWKQQWKLWFQTRVC